MPFEPTPPEQEQQDGGTRKPQSNMRGQGPGRVAVQLREEVAAAQVRRRVLSEPQSSQEQSTLFIDVYLFSFSFVFYKILGGPGRFKMARGSI